MTAASMAEVCGTNPWDFLDDVSLVFLPLGTDSQTDPDKGLWELIKFM